jgi:hypothetical protein
MNDGREESGERDGGRGESGERGGGRVESGERSGGRGESGERDGGRGQSGEKDDGRGERGERDGGRRDALIEQEIKRIDTDRNKEYRCRTGTSNKIVPDVFCVLRTKLTGI